MNIHITKNTSFQTWDKRTVFNEFPLFIRPGNFTVTLMFHDAEAIRRMADMLNDMANEIETLSWSPSHYRAFSA